MSENRSRQLAVHRRSFLTASGFALFASAWGGCSRAPTRPALAPVEAPEGALFGKARHYASVCQACPAACGLVVKNRDGRPIKLEGNPDHPLSQGGLCPVGQAWLLGLYDSRRLSGPLVAGQPASWQRLDREVRPALDKLRSQNGKVRFLTDSLVGPTRRAVIERFLEPFPDARHVTYDPLSSSAILDAHRRTHGVRVLPHYRLDAARMIVGFDADFLDTWIAPVEFAACYAAGRVPHGQPPRMSRHVQFESRMSLTGANADRRWCLAPDQIGAAMAHLAARLARKAGEVRPELEVGEAPLAKKDLDRLADELWQHRGAGLVLCGCQDEPLQVLCNYINELIGVYGSTLDIFRPSHQRQGDDRELETLLEEVRDGSVDALFIAGMNPAYDLPGGNELSESLRKVPLLVSFAERPDETAGLARYVCAETHPLETWSDVEPVAGVVGIGQPAIRPLSQTRSMLETLSAWMGKPRSARELVQSHWEAEIYPRRKEEEVFFQQFWEGTLRDGFAEVAAAAVEPKPFDRAALAIAGQTAWGLSQFSRRENGSAPFAAENENRSANPASSDQYTAILYAKVAMFDGRHAHNPWLQEMPDPVTKATWDNYACLSPTTAARLGVRSGDVVRIESPDATAEPLELPVCVQPGQHDRAVALALGYGRRETERFANAGPRWIEGRSTVGPHGRVGANAAPLLRWEQGLLRYERPGVTVAKTGRRQPLARTQRHHEITVPDHLATPGTERRPMIQEATLAEYREDPAAGGHAHNEGHADLWPEDHTYPGHHWAMAIDLAKCNGCSACVIACQAENNVPVVGKDEVRRSREMHWIRIDRYYSGDETGVATAHQPMLCHHCDNAPCETVCPVLATVHSEEGLNQQVYNRCVGTRYCANNCPYKVRRFNWFEYARPDARQNLVLNPDVTVRSRGVMEKCTFCVQRIQEAKIEARRQDRPLADGEVQPACAQSCPSRAIVFGDLNDPESGVSKLAAGPRSYQVLAELNTKAAVTYLRRIRNRQPSPEHPPACLKPPSHSSP